MPAPSNKRKILKESITRLLQLGISENEIIENLKSVGVEESLGSEILEETKLELSGATQATQAKPKVLQAQSQSGLEKLGSEQKSEKQNQPKPKTPQQSGREKDAKKQKAREETLGDNPGDFIDDVYSGNYSQDGDEQSSQESDSDTVVTKFASIPKDGQKPLEVKPEDTTANSPELAELWEKGIIATVDSRLTEMKRIRVEIDEIIDRKVAEKVSLEAKKVETILESQRQLFYGKIDLYLGAKADDLKKVLESRAKQLEDANAKVQEQVSKIHSEKSFNAELLGTINEKLTGLDTIRSQMISQVNQSLMVQDSKFREFMDVSVKKRDELEGRITRSLQLESKITEGLVEDAKNKIEALRLEKEEQLTKEIMDRAAQLEEMTSKVDPKGILDAVEKMKKLDESVSLRVKEIDPKIGVKSTQLEGKIDSRFELFRQEFSEYRESVSKKEDEHFKELREEYANSLDDLFSQQLLAWDARLKEKETKIDELEKRVDIERINATLDSLDLFKKQFVSTVEKSINDYNKTKKELAESIIERDKSINEYLERIDDKMKELSDFQKKFSQEVSVLLENVPENHKEKKGKKE